MEYLAQVFVNCIITSSLYALAGFSFFLTYKVTKFFNLAHGAMIMIGGYAMYIFYRLLNLPLYFSAISAVVMAGIIGFLFERYIFQNLRNKNSPSVIFLLASTGLMLATQSIVAIIFGSQFINLFNSQETLSVYNISGAVINLPQVLILISVLLAVLSVFLIFRYTNFGKIIRAIGDNSNLAKTCGINIDYYIGSMFFIGSAIAGWLGVLISFDTGIDPTIGAGIFLKGIIALIIGGADDIFGVIVGALLLGFTENTSAWFLSGEFKDLFSFAILIIFILIRPQGLIKK